MLVYRDPLAATGRVPSDQQLTLVQADVKMTPFVLSAAVDSWCGGLAAHCHHVKVAAGDAGTVVVPDQVDLAITIFIVEVLIFRTITSVPVNVELTPIAQLH